MIRLARGFSLVYEAVARRGNTTFLLVVVGVTTPSGTKENRGLVLSKGYLFEPWSLVRKRDFRRKVPQFDEWDLFHDGLGARACETEYDQRGLVYDAIVTVDGDPVHC